MPAPDSLRDGQPDAAPVGLGAEEGLCRAPEHFRAHPAAGISNGDDHKFRGSVWVEKAIAPVSSGVASRAFWTRFKSIDRS